MTGFTYEVAKKRLLSDPTCFESLRHTFMMRIELNADGGFMVRAEEDMDPTVFNWVTTMLLDKLRDDPFYASEARSLIERSAPDVFVQIPVTMRI